jgi:hypothetical protein
LHMTHFLVAGGRVIGNSMWSGQEGFRNQEAPARPMENGGSRKCKYLGQNHRAFLFKVEKLLFL